MSDLLLLADNLDGILNDIWARWDQGSADRRSPFHTLMVASISTVSAPKQRVMVLRKADRDAGALRFHTDLRSNKIAQLTKNTAASVIGYDGGSKIQLRASGIATVISSGPIADAAWAKTLLSGRRSYLTTLPPGSISNQATSGLPRSFETSVPTLQDSESGRANFAIILVTLDRLEWLHLASNGHRRAAFTRTENGWAGTWLIP